MRNLKPTCTAIALALGLSVTTPTTAPAAQMWFDNGTDQFIILGPTLATIQAAAEGQSSDAIGKVLNECEGTGWFAKALSSSGTSFGISCGAASRADAISVATEHCEGAGGTDCNSYSIASGYDDGSFSADFATDYTGQDAETIGASQ